MTTTQNNLVKISGNTYPVKDALKSLGARWNAADKCWMIAPDRADRAKAIVAGAGPKQPYSGPARSFGARSSSASRGRWNGCSCGARELPGGGLSANACARCRFDEYDS